MCDVDSFNGKKYLPTKNFRVVIYFPQNPPFKALRTQPIQNFSSMLLQVTSANPFNPSNKTLEVLLIGVRTNFKNIKIRGIFQKFWWSGFFRRSHEPGTHPHQGCFCRQKRYASREVMDCISQKWCK